MLPQAARLIAAAEPLVDDPVLLANCHRLRGSIELAAGTTTTAINMLITGARRLAEVDPRRSLELLALAAEGASLTLDADASRAIADAAAALDVGDDEHDRFFIALLVGFTQHLAGDSKSGIAAIREALAIADDEFDDVDLLLAAGRASFYIGDDDAALRFHTRIVFRARSIGSVGCLAIAGTRLALAEILTGRWSEANAMAEETVRLAEDTAQVELEAHALVWLALIAAWQGSDDVSLSYIERARALTAAQPIRLIDDAARWVLGAIDLGVGHAAAAFAQLEPIEHPVIAVLASLDRIEAAVGADEQERAGAWLDELATFAAASEVAWARARLAHCRALLATEPAEKETLFESALDEHRGFVSAVRASPHLTRLRRVPAPEPAPGRCPRAPALGTRDLRRARRPPVGATCAGRTPRERRERAGAQPEAATRLTAQEFRIARLRRRRACRTETSQRRCS